MTEEKTFVAIDFSKNFNVILMEINGKHKKMSIKNTLKDYVTLVKYCQSFKMSKLRTK